MQDGFIPLRGAVEPDTVARCTALLWEEIGLDPLEPRGWVDPVRWVGGMTNEPFVAAMNTPPLEEACDLLAGRGRWRRRASMGSFPLRFPHAVEPDDAGWHIEGSYLPDGAVTGDWHVNVRSRDRALLALFLFTDVGERDGPTRIRVGSHLDIPARLAAYGEAGVSSRAFSADAADASSHRPITFATGRAGDVFVCHPFLVHAAQPNHGSRPRFIGQPCVLSDEPYRWSRPDSACSPVERSIKRSLGAGPAGLAPVNVSHSSHRR